jgi:hypothetical protein
MAQSGQPKRAHPVCSRAATVGTICELQTHPSHGVTPAHRHLSLNIVRSTATIVATEAEAEKQHAFWEACRRCEFASDEPMAMGGTGDTPGSDRVASVIRQLRQQECLYIPAHDLCHVVCRESGAQQLLCDQDHAARVKGGRCCAIEV